MGWWGETYEFLQLYDTLPRDALLLALWWRCKAVSVPGMGELIGIAERDEWLVRLEMLWEQCSGDRPPES